MNVSVSDSSPVTRFSIASVMYMTATCAILLTYLKFFEPAEFMLGLTVMICVLVGGAVLGSVFQRTTEASFWSLLGAMTAFLCAIGEPLTHDAFQIAWPLVGALAAASAVLFDQQRLFTRMVIGAVIGVVVLGVFSLIPSQMGASNVWIEVVCGPVAGAIMVGVVWVLEALRRRGCYPRSGLILALTAGVIGGNVFGRWVGLL